MNLHGIGLIFTRGRGVDCFKRTLGQGWQKPAEIDVSYLKNKKSPVYQVALENIIDGTLPKKMRRSDKLSKMAVLAASDALRSSGIKNINKKNMGIIVASAFGAHVTTFDFLDDILDYGEANVSPTVFSNSVHNAAASYISSALDIQCPTLTVTHFYFSFHYALQLAKAWLNEKRCDYVLAGAVEQYGDVLGYVCNTKLKTAHDGRIKPFNFNPTYQIPGEGAVFFLLNKGDFNNAFCKVDDIRIGKSTEDIKTVDLNIIDTDGMLADESVYSGSLSPDIPVAAYSPLFGSMMIGSAFNCTAGALMLKNQEFYANPIRDNPHNIHLINETKRSNIELIHCIRYNCYGEKAAIHLRKK